MQDAYAVIQKAFVMKPRSANYIAASVMLCLMLAIGLIAWAQDSFHGWNFLWIVLFALYLWVGVMLTVAGNQVTIQNGICTVRKFFGVKTDFAIEDVMRVEYRHGFGHRSNRWDIVIKYQDRSSRAHELRVFSRLYSREDEHHFLDALGYKGLTPQD